MKKILLFMVLFLASVSMPAQHKDARRATTSKRVINAIPQIQHLQFEGVQITGTYENFLRRLRAKGFIVYPQNKNKNAPDAIGTVWGIKKCRIYVYTADDGMVHHIHVLKQFKNDNERFNNFLRLEDKYYQNHLNGGQAYGVDENGNTISLDHYKFDLGDIVSYTVWKNYYNNFSFTTIDEKDAYHTDYFFNLEFIDNNGVHRSVFPGLTDVSNFCRPGISCKMLAKDYFLSFFVDSKYDEGFTFNVFGADKDFILNLFYNNDISYNLRRLIFSTYVDIADYVYKNEKGNLWHNLFTFTNSYKDICYFVSQQNSQTQKSNNWFRQWIKDMIYSKEEQRNFAKMGVDLDALISSVAKSMNNVSNKGGGYKSNWDMMNSAQQAYISEHPTDSH